MHPLPSCANTATKVNLRCSHYFSNTIISVKMFQKSFRTVESVSEYKSLRGTTFGTSYTMHTQNSETLFLR